MRNNDNIILCRKYRKHGLNSILSYFSHQQIKKKISDGGAVFCQCILLCSGNSDLESQSVLGNRLTTHQL